LKKTLERTLRCVDGFLGILDGSKGSAMHRVYAVLRDYELNFFDPFQQSQWTNYLVGELSSRDILLLSSKTRLSELTISCH
jgi:hypothetical protein